MNTYHVTYTDQAGKQAFAEVDACNPVFALDAIMAELKPKERTKITLKDERGAQVYFKALTGLPTRPADHEAKATKPKRRRKRRKAAEPKPAPVVPIEAAKKAKRRRKGPYKPRQTPFAPPPPDATRAQLDAFLASLAPGAAR